MKGNNLYEKTIHSKNLYTGKVVTLKLDEVELANGKQETREVVEHRGAVAIIAVTSEKKVVLVRQYRYPIKDVLLELPAGKLEVNEDPIECAKRELQEETGYICGSICLLSKFYTSPGFSNEVLYLYLATHLKPSIANPDEGEFIKIEEYSMDQIKRLLKDCLIMDSKTLIGCLYLNQLDLM